MKNNHTRMIVTSIEEFEMKFLSSQSMKRKSKDKKQQRRAGTRINTVKEIKLVENSFETFSMHVHQQLSTYTSFTSSKRNK